ncbi:MAG: tetratricopeptide repeat protein [Balneolaceae bacterium]|nr:tetratricopeptide repeat protein [Balneolaceae bacterium]MCH8548820.1 tetratricopeptide repeat protein [Balneolaceae bacterium]
MKKWIILTLLISVSIVACMEPDDLPPVPSGVQGYSQLGDTLYKPDIDEETFLEYSENLTRAIADYRSDPENPDYIIWLGRRTAYLGEYREAIRIFTEGVYKHADDPRMYRHRGHRYLTLRMFDHAIRDFENAAILMRRMDDEIEPDGLPNPQNQPVSTLKSNVWYHLGLTYYLKGDYERAIEAYENAFELDLSEDMRIATLYWHYSALKRSGLDEEAGRAIRDITPEIELIENDLYLNLLLVFNGQFDAERLMEAGQDAIENATLAYGIGNWHYMNGREERAFEIWEAIVENGNWPAFGYIAAESELAAREGAGS